MAHIELLANGNVLVPVPLVDEEATRRPHGLSTPAAETPPPPQPTCLGDPV